MGQKFFATPAGHSAQVRPLDVELLIIPHQTEEQAMQSHYSVQPHGMSDGLDRLTNFSVDRYCNAFKKPVVRPPK